MICSTRSSHDGGNDGGRLRPKRVLWMVLGILAASALWLLNIEITYRRNLQHLPTDFPMRRHVITRSWRT